MPVIVVAENAEVAAPVEEATEAPVETKEETATAE